MLAVGRVASSPRREANEYLEDLSPTIMSVEIQGINSRDFVTSNNFLQRRLCCGLHLCRVVNSLVLPL